MADAKKAKAPRFIVSPGAIVDQEQKRYAPQAGNDLTELAEHCNADPAYAELFVWVPGLPKAN
jgi:hypothetical protein